MIRESIASQLDQDPDFRWRGENVTRIENLSDIVFALALGMLVSAAQAPTRLAGLETHLINIIPVAFGFFLMVSIWNAHFVFFRRYGIADSRIVLLNAVLLLVILYIAYPLRFIFDSLFAFILGMHGNWTRMEEMGIDSYRDAGRITAYFSIGFMVIYSVILAMYEHALRKAKTLNLSAAELVITKRAIWAFRAETLLGGIVAVLAVFSVLGAFAGLFLQLSPFLRMLIRRIIKLPKTS